MFCDERLDRREKIGELYLLAPDVDLIKAVIVAHQKHEQGGIVTARRGLGCGIDRNDDFVGRLTRWSHLAPPEPKLTQMNLCVGSRLKTNATQATDTINDFSDRGGALMILRARLPRESSTKHAIASRCQPRISSSPGWRISNAFGKKAMKSWRKIASRSCGVSSIMHPPRSTLVLSFVAGSLR